MKRIAAIIVAALVTGLIAVCILFVGANAVLKPNSVPVNDSPNSAAVVSNTNATDAQAQAQIQQLQSLVQQYQARDQQYQAQIDQLNGEVQQLQNVLLELQQRGIIRIQSDGSIQLRRGN